MTEQPLESHNAECRRWWAQCRKMKKWLKFQLLVTKSRIERRQLERHMELETRDQKAWAAARLSGAARTNKSREKQFAPAHGWASLPWVAEPTRAGWWGVRWPSGRVVGVHLVVHAEIFGPMISDSKVVSWKDCGYHDGVWWAGPYDSLEALREAMTPNGEVSHDSADQKL